MRLNTNGVAPSDQLVELPVELAFEFQRHFLLSNFGIQNEAEVDSGRSFRMFDCLN